MPLSSHTLTIWPMRILPFAPAGFHHAWELKSRVNLPFLLVSKHHGCEVDMPNANMNQGQ